MEIAIRKILKSIRPNLFILAAVSIGGALEWYEIGLFISWPLIIWGDSDLFDESLINAFSLTGVLLMVGFALASGGIRGIGGWFFGRKGDKEGRKGAFSLTVLWAAIPSILLPLFSFFVPFDKWRYWSAIIFSITKFIQGMPAGGEFPGAICYLAESSRFNSNIAPWIIRRYMCSFTILGPQIGLMLAMIVCLILKSFFSDKFLLQQGWQYIFLISGMLGIIVYLMRCKLHETASFLKLKTHNEITTHPVKTVFTKYLSRIVFGFNLSIFETALFIVISLIPLYYAQGAFNLPSSVVISFSIASTLLRSFFLIFIGFLLVKYAEFPWLKVSAWGVIILSIFLYKTLESGSLFFSLLINIAMIFLYSIQAAILPSLLAELFPTSVRYTGIAFSFNICDGILLTVVTSVCFIVMSMNSASFVALLPISGFLFLLTLKSKHAKYIYFN